VQPRLRGDVIRAIRDLNISFVFFAIFAPFDKLRTGFAVKKNFGRPTGIAPTKEYLRAPAEILRSGRYRWG
jgi:hypothetical protein